MKSRVRSMPSRIRTHEDDLILESISDPAVRDDQIEHVAVEGFKFLHVRYVHTDMAEIGASHNSV